MMEDIITSIATGLTPSGIGIIRISGKGCISMVDQIFQSIHKGKKLIHVDSHTLHYGKIIDPDQNEIIDEALVSVMKAPNTYTKEDLVEINSHGGIIVMQNVLRLVLKRGARLAEPGEFTKRAFLNGRIDLSQAEAVMDIINSKTDLGLKSSISQLNGSLSTKIQELKDSLLELIAHIEASIDYPEYDIEHLTSENILQKLENIKNPLQKLIDTFDHGKLIKEGIRTAIIGKPNVGKSSLLNALLREQRAIVTDIPGTTRDLLEEYMNIHGIPLKLIDTAGIRETEDLVEKLGVKKSQETIENVDLVLFMVDASQELSDEDFKIIELIKNKKTIVLLNKIDLTNEINKNRLSTWFDKDLIIPTSMKELEGIEKLENTIKDLFTLGNIHLESDVYITNVRQKNALYQCLNSLDEVIEGLSLDMPVDLLAIDLKSAYDFIGEVTGDSMSEDLVDQIFSQFCLGK